MATLTQSAAAQRLVLDNIDWPTYSRLLKIFAHRPAVRLAYDRGRLEIMSPLREHESDSELLGRFVTALTEELGLTISAGGSTTYRRRAKRRGLEPDKSYWIAHEPSVRTKRRLNLKTDPPPDLAIEVDLTSSSLDRLGICAALKVPEVWRLEEESLTILILDENGKYADGESVSFPHLKASDLTPFLLLHFQLDQNAIIRQFRDWIRQRIAAGWK